MPKVLYGFGREDQLDTGGEDLEFTESRPYGGAYVLDQLWKRLGIAAILTGLASSGRGRPRDAAAAERVLFGLVANRALAPSSTLAASE